MSIGDSITGLFSNTQNTTSQTQGQNSGTGTSQSNLWPQLGGYFGQYANTAFNPAQFNQYQTGAANNQAGVTSNLNPGFGAASSIAQGGLNPASIAQFQNPYTQSVVKSTTDVLNNQHARDLAGQQASAALSGRLTGSGTRNERRLSDQQFNQNVLAPTVANLNSQGFNTAAGLAGQSAGLQLSGAGQLGNLTGAATGANQAGFQQGQTLWQNPLSWMTQGAQGLSPFLQGAGQNTSYSGTSSGTSTGDTTSTQGLGTVGAGLAGAWLMSDERVKENIKPIGKTFDGQTIHKYNYIGSPTTQIGLIAQDVEQAHPHAVGHVGDFKTVNYDAATKGSEHRAQGGSVNSEPNSFAAKVRDAFSHFHTMRKEAQGGAVNADSAKRGYDWGGTVAQFNGGPDSSNDAYWDSKVSDAEANPNGGPQAPSAASKFGKGMMGFANSTGQLANPNAIAEQQRGLTEFMGRMPRPQGFAAGGDTQWGENTVSFGDTPSETASFLGREAEPKPTIDVPPRPATGTPYAPMRDELPAIPPPRSSDTGSWLAPITSALGSLFENPYKGGIWDGKEATARQRLGMALTQVGDASGRSGPFGGMGRAGIEMSQEYLKKQEAERAAAALMGQYRGQPTVAGRELALSEAKNPTQIELLKAQTEKAKMDADRDYQLKLAQDKARFDKELAEAAERAKWDRVFELRKRLQDDATKTDTAAPATPNQRLQWVPTAPVAPPPPAAAAAPVAPAPPTPSTPPRNNRGALIMGTPESPFQAKEQAGFGQYYRGADGQVYRRGSMRTGDSVYYGAQ